MNVRQIALFTVPFVAWLLAIILTPAAIRIGLRFGIADAPGGRRAHNRITSRLGVLPIALSFAVAAIVARVFDLPTEDYVNERTRFVGLLLGTLIMFLAGLADDRFQLGPAPQFLAQALAAIVAIIFLIFIEFFRNPLTDQETQVARIGAIAISMVWFMGMTNTTNWLDGVDGLAASVALIASALTALHMLYAGQFSVALLPLALCGTLVGFLMFNLPPARIFLGSGAPLLGYLLACLGIIAGAKVAVLLLVMGLPIADVAWQIAARLLRGSDPTKGDRGHLHFRLQDRGWSANAIVLMYSAACLVLGGMSLLPLAPLTKLVVLAIVFVSVALTLAWLARKVKSGA